MNQRFPGLKPCARPFAHFEWRGNYITVMHTNDLVKRQALSGYLTYVQNREARKCLLVCTPGQVKDLQNQFMNHDVELIIDEGTETEVQKPSAIQKTHNHSSPNSVSYTHLCQYRCLMLVEVQKQEYIWFSVQ